MKFKNLRQDAKRPAGKKTKLTGGRICGIPKEVFEKDFTS